ncbi:MAG TPA: hemolysin family protein [Bacteroidia bacterium]|nr:hemolysin family protein [Bacteroidia bacterium]HRG51300.1 hemolysin family protein [Bacteroidia bacterium]
MSPLLIILITLIASAFFSGLEIAFITSNKLRIELESKQGNFAAKILAYFNKYPSRYLGTMLLGNNIALVIFGIYMDDELEPIIENFTSSNILILLISTFISTMLILITAEFLPKNLFRINPNKTLTLFAFPLTIVYGILYPVVMISIGSSEFILKKIFRVKIEKENAAFTMIDLDNYVREGTSAVEKKVEMDHEIQIFQNALDFSSVKARECMIPRTEIVAVEVNESIEALRQKFVQTRLSKILVYEKNIDNIIGYAYSKELFKKPSTIKSIMLPVSIVPESMAASEVLTVFIQQNKSIALVVDEFGGTSGMLTMEDVMEEIFGEIEDEHDKEELIEKQLNETEFIFSARLETDYINNKYRLKLPILDNVETIGGLIMSYHENIPRVNEEIHIENAVFTILSVTRTRIETVSLKIQNVTD